jgi:outer membrane autotransporter protein
MKNTFSYNKTATGGGAAAGATAVVDIQPSSGGAMNRPVKSGDRSPHSIKIPPACYGVRRPVAAFDGGIHPAAPTAGAGANHPAATAVVATTAAAVAGAGTGAPLKFGILLVLGILTFGIFLPPAPAKEITFNDWDAGTTINATMVSGDTIKITGAAGAGTLVLSNDLTLAVTDWVHTQSMVGDATNKDNLTFSAAGGGWALIEMSGTNPPLDGYYGPNATNNRVLRHGSNTVTDLTVTLDKVILAKGGIPGTATDGGNAYFSSNSTKTITVAGDVVFLRGVAKRLGGGAYSTTPLIFTGTVVFDSNIAGATFTNGNNGGTLLSGTGATGAYGGGFAASQSVTFQKPVFFLSNESRSASTGIGGGGLYLSGAASVATFHSDASFWRNRSIRGGGGGIAVGTALFNGPLSIRENYVGGSGGGLRITTQLDINTSFDISSNLSDGYGGAGYLLDFNINGSGTFANNIAKWQGGAIFAGDSVAANETVDGARYRIAAVGGDIAFLDNISGPGNNVAGVAGGGAIAVHSTLGLSLAASGGDIIFQGNKAGATTAGSGSSASLTATGGTPNAIYFYGSSGSLALDAAAGRAIRFFDPITATDTTVLTITKTGAGAVVFDTYSSTFAAATTVAAGIFRLTGGAIYGKDNASGSFDLRPGATLSLNGTLQAGAITIGGGATVEVVEGGLFTLDSAATVTIAAGGGATPALHLAGSGTLQLAPLGAGWQAASIRVGADTSAGAQTLALVDNVTLADGAIISVDLFNNNQGDRLALENSAALAATGSVVLDLATVRTGVFNLGNFGALAGALNLTINGETPPPVGRRSASFSESGGDIIVVASADMSRTMTWTGAGAGGTAVWDLGTENWSDQGDQGAAVTRFGGGDRVIFDTSAAPAARVVQLGGAVSVSDMEVNGAADYRFEGAGGITADAATVVEVDDASAVDDPGGKLKKNGAGTLTFANTGANAFTGGIEISGGAIAFDHTAQLGTGGLPVVFAAGGGTLRLNAAGMTLGTALAVGDGATATLDTNGHDATLAAPVTGAAGTFAKTGARTLAVQNEIRTGWLNVDEGAVRLSGAGRLRVAAGIAIGAGGTLAAADAGALSTPDAAPVTLANAGRLALGAAAGAATLVRTSFNGNYAGNGGSILLGVATEEAGAVVGSDSLSISGTVSGTVRIEFLQQAPLAAGARWKYITTNFPAFAAAAWDSAAGVICSPIELDNGIDRTLLFDAATGKWSWRDERSHRMDAVMGVDAASILIGRASLEALTRRLGTALALAPGRGLRLWAAGLQAHEKINSSLYSNAAADTHGAQAGGDWGVNLGDAAGTHRLTVGVFADYATQKMQQDNAMSGARATVDATGGGAYLAWQHGRWSAAALVRLAGEDYEVTVPEYATAMSMSGDSRAASLEIGGVFKDQDGLLNWEPQLQLTWQAHDIDNLTDERARHYDLDTAESLESRVGVRLWLEREWKPGLRVIPWLRVSYLHEFRGETTIRITGADGAPNACTSTLGGDRGALELGATMQLARRLTLDARAGYTHGDRTQGHGFDLGCAYSW